MIDTIAIDFGTMRTKVAYRDPMRNTLELMRLGQDERPFVPSLFFLGEDGRRLFGDEAADFLDSDPLGFLPRPLKRELREQWVRAGNRVKATPTELLSILFAGLRKRTSEIACFRDAPPKGLVLTVPAQYGPPDRDILTASARNAGFHDDCITFIDEPIAAAQAWLAELNGKEEYVVVLDCGGGTLDWACLHRTAAGKFEMMPDLPAGGDNRVGGYDIDESMYVIVDDAITDENTRTELHAKQSYIRDQIRALKEKHSRTGSGGKIRVGNVPVEIPPEVIDDIITRRFISQACQNLCSYLEKVRDRLKIEKPTVLLVGGSARLRGFKEAVEQQGRCQAVWWERSEYATVLGAVLPSAQEGHTQSNVSLVPCRKPIDAKAKAFIATQKKRHEDFRYFLRETFLVQWRLSNSVLTSANNFAEILSTIHDGEQNQSIALKVRQGLESVNIVDFEEIVTQTSTGFVEMVSGFIEDLPSRHIRLYSGLEQFHAKFIPPEGWKDTFVKDVAKDLLGLKKDFDAIAGYYQQLAEFYPRYDGIMSRSGWLDWLIGGAVGFFTGGLGIAAAVIWGGWRGMNDEQFMQNYSAAVQDFINACVKFNEGGERVLNAYIQRANDVWNDAFKPMAELYLALAEAGEDLESVERRVHEVDHAVEFAESVAAHQFVALVVANLRQEADLSKRSLDNIIDDLRSSGIFLTDTGDLDEAAVAALPPDQETKLLTDLTSEVMAAIQRSFCCSSDRFHVAPHIPEEKMINALREYGHGCNANDVLCLYDDTFFGGGGDGFMVTRLGIWWTGPNARAWTEIKRITKAADSNAVKIDGVPVSIAMASDFVPYFASLLKEVRECVVSRLSTDHDE